MWNCRKFCFCLVLLFCVCLIETSDICASLCRCRNESHFVKIHCDFLDYKEYTLDGGLKLPYLATAVNITLGDKTRLAIRNGFFSSSNKINSLILQGLRDDFKMTKNHVTIWKHALNGIWGNFPEISFRNINSVILSEKSLDGLLEINLIVENVWQFIANKEVFGTTSFNASFSEIAELILDDGVLQTTSFNLTKPKIYINRSWIRNFLPMRGKKLTELRIENSEIETVKSSAFNILEIPSIILDNVTIHLIESDIFREGIALENLAVTNCKIDVIASKAIHDVGITKFLFEKNTINSIEENSIEFAGSSISISHNKINFLGLFWLKSNQWHKVSVFNNTFGSFDAISLENPTLDNVQCTLHHNSFTKPQPDSFKSISEKCHFTELLFKQNCACNFHKWLEKLFVKSVPLKQLQSESFCSLDTNDTLLRCLKAETVKFEQYHEEICKGKRVKLKCNRVKVDKIDAKFIDSKVLSDEFEWMDYINYIIPAAVCAALFPCVCFALAVRRKSRNTVLRQETRHQTDLLHFNPSEAPPSYEASLRPRKIFSNRDQVIIKRTLETMKQKQPEEKFEIVHQNTKRLLSEHLNEYETVKIIGDIVQTLGECEDSADFVAFTDILYKHLAPDTTTTLQLPNHQRPQDTDNALYIEPGLLLTGSSKSNAEHIYAEPTVLSQQHTMIPLLLANNYSSPLDSSTSNNNLYSEPVNHDSNVGPSKFKSKAASPYAISETIDQPFTLKNLPDIVNRVDTGPFKNDLNRITRSPTTNRKIPEYTVPSVSHKRAAFVTQENIEDWNDETMENSTSSNHSGGSNATVKIEEIFDDKT